MPFAKRNIASELIASLFFNAMKVLVVYGFKNKRIKYKSVRLKLTSSVQNGDAEVFCKEDTDFFVCKVSSQMVAENVA